MQLKQATGGSWIDLSIAVDWVKSNGIYKIPSSHKGFLVL
jgi:hypothetical protein